MQGFLDGADGRETDVKGYGPGSCSCIIGSKNLWSPSWTLNRYTGHKRQVMASCQPKTPKP